MDGRLSWKTQKSVSILVVVDDGRRLPLRLSPLSHLRVSILVVVDDGRRPPAAGPGRSARGRVSILVVVDDGRRRSDIVQTPHGAAMFQSLLLWMTVVGYRASHLILLVGNVFQSLLLWMTVV